MRFPQRRIPLVLYRYVVRHLTGILSQKKRQMPVSYSS
jgi:hypothetical protein